MSRRRAFVSTFLLGLLLAAGSQLVDSRDGAAAPTAESVTFGVRDFRNANGVRVLVFSGAVSDRQAGQEVEILGQDCGVRHSRLIAGTQTTAGGAFQAENPQQSFPWSFTPVSSGITFRARWKGVLSAPVQYRLPAVVSAAKVRGRAAWTVRFGPAQLPVPYAGRAVELQRWSGGRWVRIQTARLKLKPSLRFGAFNHEVVFSVPRRGLRLRAYLPARSAAPCWLPNATDPWRS
ncbi:MAG TPA: hypothetical protein VML35_01080 [Gaiellaceae bacterium]|nr:hypothetical protein [Gaiellaceae bacterium]